LKSLESVFGPNSALVEELYKQYQENPDTVPNHWKNYFDELEGVESKKPSPDENGVPTVKEKPAPAKKPEKKAPEKREPEPTIPESAELQKIKGVASKIVDNMDESIYVPTATSLRVLPVKMMAEDRAIINTHLLKTGHPKASFTHLIGLGRHQSDEGIPHA